MTEEALRHTLDTLEQTGRTVKFWLRDDDATEPSAPLDRLLDLLEEYSIPAILAVIPASTGQELVRRLDETRDVGVAVHGWSHTNHADADEKKQELGHHRPLETVLAELGTGFQRLRDLHGPRFVPMLVPPWNRIDSAVTEGLTGLGFEALSGFGPEKNAALPLVNTHVDLMDWHVTRGGRDHETLMAEIVARIQVTMRPGGTVGILTHHLVHDDTAWGFLEKLFDLTADHPACRWLSAQELLSPAILTRMTDDRSV